MVSRCCFHFFKLVSRGTSLTYFLIDIMFKVTPYWLCFCFRQKGGDWQKEGERFLPLIVILFIVLIFTPLLMIDKKGEKDFEFICFYMHIYGFAYIKFNWYLEHVYLFLKISLISRTFIVYACFMFHNLLHIYVYLFMHELRGSFFEA